MRYGYQSKLSSQFHPSPLDDWVKRQAFQRPDVILEVANLVVVVVACDGPILEGETGELSAFQTLVECSGFGLVEAVVDDDEGDRDAGRTVT